MRQVSEQHRKAIATTPDLLTRNSTPSMSENLSWSEKSLKGFRNGKTMMYIMTDINTVPSNRSARTHQGSADQPVSPSRSRLRSSSCATCSRTASSWASRIQSPCSSRSLNFSTTPCVHWKMSIIPPIWASMEKKSSALDRPSYLFFISVLSGSVLACTMKEPESVNGMMRKTTGRVPSSIWSIGSFKTPVRTEVGQSGPHTSTITLSTCSPG
mmetsp:Transcript_131037/g.407537  ORF Transcript_131037/g.407537 Transcript_131037/m.407537 type:complete len:213 (+) Transcript_131037:153-791(+)